MFLCRSFQSFSAKERKRMRKERKTGISYGERPLPLIFTETLKEMKHIWICIILLSTCMKGHEVQDQAIMF